MGILKYLWAAHYIVTNFNFGTIENHTVEIHVETFAHENVASIIAEERRLNSNIFFCAI